MTMCITPIVEIGESRGNIFVLQSNVLSMDSDTVFLMVEFLNLEFILQMYEKCSLSATSQHINA